MWYVQTSGGGKQYTIWSALTGLTLSFDPFNRNTYPFTITPSTSSSVLWTLPIENFDPNTSAIGYAISQDKNGILLYENSGGTIQAGQPGNIHSIWQFKPVTTPSSEVAQQQLGPAGYTYCADGDQDPVQTCTFTRQASIAYGVKGPGSTAGSFRYILNATSAPGTTNLVACNVASFSGIDPAPGRKKACFYAPMLASGDLPIIFYNLNNPILEGQTFTPPTGHIVVAYGAQTVNGGLYTYKDVSSSVPMQHQCSVMEFGLDPAVNVQKYCFLGYAEDFGPSDFSECAGDDQYCPFSGTAVIAYGDASIPSLTYKTFTNGVYCSAASFGLAPLPIGHNSCFYKRVDPMVYSTSTSLPLPTSTPFYFRCAQGDVGQNESHHLPTVSVSLLFGSKLCQKSISSPSLCHN